jgi:selenocysteine lyase/cysteine desulfurase
VAPISTRAAEAMRWYVDRLLETGGVGQEFYARAEKVRESAARLIHASADEVTFVKNTTEGIGWVAGGLDWRDGDNAVTTDVEFPANIYPWMALENRGVELRMVAEDDGRIPPERIADAIDDRTRVLTVSAIEYASGYRMDLTSLGALCRKRGVLFCVDAIQTLGVFPVDVQSMKIDFLSADGHKWLCGPEGSGLFYCRRELLSELKPVIAGWLGMVNPQDFGNYQFEFQDTARRFDLGSYNLAGVFGLGAAINLWLDVGIDHVSSHVLMLTDRLVERLKDKDYRIISSRRKGEASGIVSFVSDVHDLAALRDRLEKEHSIVTAFREGRLRASPHAYNTIEEIDQLADALPAH